MTGARQRHRPPAHSPLREGRRARPHRRPSRGRPQQDAGDDPEIRPSPPRRWRWTPAAKGRAEADRSGVRTFGRLDVVYANAGIKRRTDVAAGHHGRTSTRSFASTCSGRSLAIKYAAPHMMKQAPGSHRLHGLGRGAARNAGRRRLFGQQSRRHRAGADCTANALDRHGTRQRDLPRTDRDRHDETDLRHGRSRGTDGKIGQLNPLQRADVRKRSPRWRCFWRATKRPTSAARRSPSTAACRRRIRSPSRGKSPRPSCWGACEASVSKHGGLGRRTCASF